MEEKKSIDWVKVRASCSVRQMFDKLKLEIQNDIKIRNELLRAPREYEFRYTPESTGSSFSVMKAREGAYEDSDKTVTFKCDGSNIIVEDTENKPVLKASITLNDEGECMFKINGRECASWQLRRMVLESLFFEGDSSK